MSQTEFRYFDLRYEENTRTISGTALKYGDEATLPWGTRERFEAGAFGSLRNADIILNVQHSRERPVSRTGGGGLEIMDDSRELRVKATLPETRDGDEVLGLVKSRILRGFSIEFRPIDIREEMKDKVRTDIITKAELVNVAVVDRPAYPQSLIDARSHTMDEKKIEEIMTRMLGGNKGDMAKAVAGELKELVEASSRAQVDDALKQRDDATAKAEADKKTAEDARTKTEAEVEQRADLLVMCRAHTLFPKDYDTKGKSLKDLMVAACGDEVKEAAKQNEDYLRAKLEAIVERREQAGTTGTSVSPVKNGAALFRPLRIDQMRTIEKGA